MTRSGVPTAAAGQTEPAVPAPKLAIDHVRIDYRSPVTHQPFCAVDDVSFTVPKGRLVSVIGPSGCGKSTLLGAIAGLVPYTGGQVTVDGEKVTKPGKDRAVVFQKSALLPWRTAEDNVAYPLVLGGMKRQEARAKARDVLSRVGLADFARHYPDHLSGGMQQRVNVARALAVEPELLLLDEPFAAVDAQMREILQEEVLGLLESSAFSGVFVTHQIDEAVLVGDSVVILSRGPGSTVREIVDVPLARPRGQQVRRSPEFLELVDHVWGVVKGEIEAGYGVPTEGRP
ncbi:MAG TPA: ABC transporter ATP-binding protein [Pseudonocardiaceae bacterium]